MSAKKTKLEVFGDEYSRCLVSSIAGYDLLEEGKILIHLKSGGTMELLYQVEYLAKIAFTKLNSYFKIDTPESVACNVCTNKGKEYESMTFCDYCFNDKEYFEAPAEAKDE